LPEPLYERAEQLARLRQQDVATVLEEILDDTLPPVTDEEELFDLSESDDPLDREMAAYIAMHPLLKEKYFGKHVAVYGGQLIDYDEMKIFRHCTSGCENDILTKSYGCQRSKTSRLKPSMCVRRTGPIRR
jgi:hypothetical protein